MNNPSSNPIGFLKDAGLPPVIPPIRSSDLTGCANPLVYYLARRLQLVPQLSWNDALNKGSWFHYSQESPSRNVFEMKLAERLDSLCQLCAEMGLSDDGLRAVLDRETKDALTAWAWAEAWSKVVISPKHGTIADVKRRLGVSLGREILVWTYRNRVAQFDELFYDEKHGRIWIWDDKTTGLTPSERLQSCAREPQCIHYIRVAQDFIGPIRDVFGLPKDTKVAGMVHAAYQKPSITFGLNDRDYVEKEFTPSRGKNKGITRIEKEYVGEPVIANYVARTLRWLTSTDEYSHLATERALDPCVNVSTVFADKLDTLAVGWYDELLSRAVHYATVYPDPKNFPPNLYDMRRSPYLPFALTNVENWPSIVQRERFVRRSRDHDRRPGVYQLAESTEQRDARDPGACGASQNRSDPEGRGELEG